MVSTVLVYDHKALLSKNYPEAPFSKKLQYQGLAMDIYPFFLELRNMDIR